MSGALSPLLVQEDFTKDIIILNHDFKWASVCQIQAGGE